VAFIGVLDTVVADGQIKSRVVPCGGDYIDEHVAIAIHAEGYDAGFDTV
jgi:hypothetical protein